MMTLGTNDMTMWKSRKLYVFIMNLITLKDKIQSLINYFNAELINRFTGHISKAIRAYSQDALN